MIRGLTTSASGMLTDERMVQNLANNLANAQTPGYKSVNGESLSFPEQLIESMKYGDSSGSVIGEMGTGSVYQEGVPYFGEGQLQNTGRSLDVAIQDNTPVGTYASVLQNNQLVSQQGTVTAGNNGRLEMGGTPLAVLNGLNQPVSNVYAVKNPNYKGTAFYASDGSPAYDSQGNPSYIFENQNGQPIHTSDTNERTLSVRIGNQNDMGVHDFFAVNYQSFQGKQGLALTKDGHFSVNANHDLVDSNGHEILPIGQNGKPIQNGRIEINPSYQGKELFDKNGLPLTDANGQPSFKIVDTSGKAIANAKFGTVGADVTQLNSLGQNEYMVNQSLTNTNVTPTLYASTGTISPGELEGSNVNTTADLTNMTMIMQEYQANQTALQTEGQALNDAATDIGKVNI